MVVYFVDAFNLVHRVDSLRASDTPHQALMRYLRRGGFTGSAANKVFVVFDGGPVRDLDPCGYSVIFSGPVTADDIIKDRVAGMPHPRQAVVVSDDRALRDKVRDLGAGVMRLDEFIAKAKKPKGSDDGKDISYTLADEITREMRDIWGIR